MSNNSAVEEFWRSFVSATGIDGTYTAWGFALEITGPKADTLGPQIGPDITAKSAPDRIGLAS
jgi:hypothetical protein